MQDFKLIPYVSLKDSEFPQTVLIKIEKKDFSEISFQEGKMLYPGSNFTSRLHIEICVLNAELIKGYFLPIPIDEFNPYLSKNPRNN